MNIAPDVFATLDDDVSNEEILVRGDFDSAAAVAALERAAQRFMNVDERGFEHPDALSSLPTDEQGRELYTPNYVSTPEVTSRGITMYVDCKGYIERAMRARFLAILDEELSPLGVVYVENVSQPR